MNTKAAPMNKEETMLLVELIAANAAINNKSTKAATNRMKDQAWLFLSEQFNNSSVSCFPRTPAQLRLKWENLKKSARKRTATMRYNHDKTEGGMNYIHPCEVLDKVDSILGNTCQGLPVASGGEDSFHEDAGKDSYHESVIDSCHEGAVIDSCHEGVGEDSCHEDAGEDSCHEDDDEEEDLKEVQMIETSPKHDFVLKKGSDNEILAKKKIRMEIELYRARILRENAFTELLLAKKRKIDLENEEKELTIAKLTYDLQENRFKKFRK